MKSPEQIGGQSEQPKEEPVKDKKETSEKSTSSEYYHDSRWEALKLGFDPSSAINGGKRIGVPQEELNRFAEDVIARETETKNYGLVYRLRKNMGIGTEKEVRTAGEKAYKSFLKSRDFDSAMGIAEDVYGRDSEEWRRANKANEAERKKTEEKRKREEEKMEDEEWKWNASISKNATFADLFNAIDAIEEEKGWGALHFEEELWDNFDEKTADEVLDFRVQDDKAATTKVLDFFKERGYSQSDVSVFLPIKFKRERKKK